MNEKVFEACGQDFFVRPRLHKLLEDAVKRPLTIVCAGAGYGKTYAVSEFTQSSSIPIMWLQFSERDNAGSRFWAKYVHLCTHWSEAFAEECRKLGFPDTEDRLNRYMALRKQYIGARQHIIVMDDVQLITHPDILRFLDVRLNETLKNASIILICRDLQDVNLAGKQVRGLVSNIDETDLSFTEDELANYLSQQGLTVPRQNLRDILEDTGGWAFAVNLVSRSMKKSPGYAGYVRTAMKQNIFRLMETEVFDTASPALQKFLIRLSLIDHLSADLVSALADADTLAELRSQNAYVRFNSGINAYLIHHLFLDFLRTKQELLTKEEASETYRIAAHWCEENGFEIDALNYMEKTGDYAAIVSLLSSLPVQMPLDIARLAAEIFERAESELADNIYLFAVTHIRMIMRLGRWEDALKLIRGYERRFLPLPKDDAFRNRTLGLIYFHWGNISELLSTTSDIYDFDRYYAKMDECFTIAPVEPDQYSDMPIGLWASLVGSSRKGAPQEYIAAAKHMMKHISHCWGGAATGIDELCHAELLFYQGNIRSAEPIFIEVARKASENGQFEIAGKALFYLLRLALWQGSREKAEQALSKIESGLERGNNSLSLLDFDAANGWYMCALRQPEKVPAWLKDNFSPYSHAYFVSNFGNQIKARYYYLTRNFSPLLAYIEDMKARESILYGRIEMLAMEACIHHQMKDRSAALAALCCAFEAASPNAILIPFVELGKDMRTVISTAQKTPNCDIPAEWLETVRRKAASFAKQQSFMFADYQKASGSRHSIALSSREREILSDLYHGLSRPEISSKRALSINTVNSAINSVFNKLGAHNIADAVRIAAEEKLV